MALAGAMAAAGHFMLGRKLRRAVGLPVYALCTYGSAALCLLLLVVADGQSLAGHSGRGYLFCGCLALVSQLIGHSAFNWVLRWLPATTVSVLLIGEPITAMLLATIMLAETPGPQELLGGGLILLGIVLASRR